MWELLINNIARRKVCLTPEEIEILQALFSVKRYRRHQYLLQQGDSCRYEFFVVEGLARIYEVDDKGQEHILQFTPEDWWTGDLYSFLTDKPSACNIDCLEDTVVLRINRENLETLFEKVPKMNVYFRILYQNSLIAFNQRLGSALSKSAWNRYQEFIQRYPLIEQRVPDHQIAAFLGIAPQSLSRLRRQSAGASRR